jgi:hypothetical protein
MAIWGNWASGNSCAANGHDTAYSTTTTDASWRGWNDGTSGTSAIVWGYWHNVSASVTVDANSSYYDVFPYWVRDAHVYVQEQLKTVVFDCNADGLLIHTAHRRAKRYEAIKRRRAEKVRRKKIARVAMEAQRKREADKKARQLLEDVLGLEQYRVYRETGRILVHGQKHDWIVHSSGMVQRFEKHKVIDLCVRLKDPWKYPKDDNIVALALTAKLNEDLLVEKANKIRDRDKTEAPDCAMLELAV